MNGPLGDHLRIRQELDGLHLAIELSRNLPFRPVWVGNQRVHSFLLGRFNLRPAHHCLGTHLRLRRRHSRTSD